MTPRAMGTIARTVVAIFAAAVSGALSFAVAASAQAPAKPSPKASKPPVLTITITGPDVSPPIVIRSTEEPRLYAQVAAQVSWMKSATGNVMPSTPTQLGPAYTVTMMTGTTKTAVYDLYPLVATGPRAHRVALGSQKAAWFFAPVAMASGLEAAGVTFPTSQASGQAAPPTVATSAPSTSFSKIMAQSKIALGLAAVAAAAMLVMLALAARRSRRLDRRRAMPAALARLETVAGRARGSGLAGAAMATSGAALRPAVPAARVEARPAKATGTARVRSPSQATSSTPNPGSAPPSAVPTGSAGRLGSAAESSPVGSTPAETPGSRSTGSWFGSHDAGERSPNPAGVSSAPVGHPGADDRAVGIAPAPRAPADDAVEPQLSRAYVTPGAAIAADRASVTPTAEVETPDAEPTSGETDMAQAANAEPVPALSEQSPDADSDAETAHDAGAVSDADAGADSDAVAASDADDDVRAETGHPAEPVTDPDENEDDGDGLDLAGDEMPATASDHENDVTLSTAETEIDSDASGPTAAGDPDAEAFTLAAAVPTDSESDHDGTATGAGPAGSAGERP